MKILVFDTETTGLPLKNEFNKEPSIYDYDKWPYIIQISCILYDLSTNETIIKKTVKYIPPSANEKITADKSTTEDNNLILISLGRVILNILFNTSKPSISIIKIVDGYY